MKKEIFRIENGQVSQNGNRLLTDFCLHVFESEIIGLIYDNYNEMQCLVDLLRGDIQADSARIFFNETYVSEAESLWQLKAQIQVINERSQLFKSMTVSENLFAFLEPESGRIIKRKTYEVKTKNILDYFNLAIDPQARIAHLLPCECSLVELIKAYLQKKSLVVLTNLTGFLSSLEIDKVLRIVDFLIGKGMSFLVIDNNIKFLTDLSDRMAIVSKGRTVAVLDSDECTDDRVENILYYNTSSVSFQKSGNLAENSPKRDEKMLEFRNIATARFANISFSVNRGEIATLLCMENTSYMHLRDLLIGGLKPDSGEITLAGRPYDSSNLWRSVKNGLCMIEENPTESMLFRDRDILTNCCCNMLDKIKGLILWKRYKISIRDTIGEFFSPEELKVPVSSLAPYKQQLLVYCKWFLYAPGIVICMKPFSSVDLHMYEATREMIQHYARKGIAVLVLSTNLSDIYAMEAKTFIIKDGRLIYEK